MSSSVIFYGILAIINADMGFRRFQYLTTSWGSVFPQRVKAAILPLCVSLVTLFESEQFARFLPMPPRNHVKLVYDGFLELIHVFVE